MSGFYKDLPQNARVYSHPTSIPVSANQTEYRLEEKSSIEGRRLLGVWIQTPVSGGKDPYGNAILPTANLKSAYLTIVEGNTNIHKMIPFQHIIACNENGVPFHISSREISMSESSIRLGLTSGITAGDQIVLTFDYLKEK